MTQTHNGVETIIAAFKIGRGGHFNNAGHLRFVGFKKIGEFTDDLFLEYENLEKYKKRYGFEHLRNLVNNNEWDLVEEEFGLTESDMGEKVYYDEVGHKVGLTEDEALEGIGRINIDNGYDTTYCTRLADCDAKELQLIIDSGIATDDITAYCTEQLANQ
jgi:hypothetical protein